MGFINLTDLPQEILGRVFTFLEPSDVARVGQTCTQLGNFTSPSNQLLWRDAFLHIYDDPESAFSSPSMLLKNARATWDWYKEVKARSLALQSLDREVATETDHINQQQYLETILNIIDTAKSHLSASELAANAVPRNDDRSSRNIRLLTSIMSQSDLGFERLVFDVSRKLSENATRPQTRSVTAALRDQKRSDAARRLHTLAGLSNRDKTERRNFYRRYVYDWALTSDANDHGPFTRDGSGRVDWTLLEAAMTCISYNFTLAVDGHLTPPTGLHYSIPNRMVPVPNEPEDWAGVTGKWFGTYAFLDYSSLLAWNAGLMDVRIGGFTQAWDLRDEPEACGDLLRMDLKLDDSVRGDPVLRSNVPICDKLPPLYFSGISRGSEYPHHPVTTIKGFAALAAGGREVKWKLIVEYHGVDQWQLEGVQPGGVRAGGIFGLWSNVEHEPNGPVGPFCYFPERLCKPTSIVLATEQ